MYIKKESFLGIYPDDQIFVQYISESEFEMFFRHSGPTGAMVYRFEGSEQKLISSQRRSYMGYSKPELDEKKNWKLFRDEFFYLSYFIPLLIYRQVLVDDTNASCLGHRYCQATFRYSIHSS